MINKIKSFINTPDKKQVVSNIFSLSILQIMNYILPLLTFPYLVRVLGIELFGLLAFINGIIFYFTVLTEYSFNLVATKEIAIHRKNKAKIIEIFSSVMSIQFILMLISFFLLLILSFVFNDIREYLYIYIFAFGSVVGKVFFPQWFFQGMEQMKYITYLNIIIRVFFTLLVFVIIKDKSDYIFVPLLNSIAIIIVGIISLFIIKNKFDIDFKIPSLELMKIYLYKGWHIFSSSLFTLVYTKSVIVILGVFTNNTLVGYYALAEKIIMIVSSVFASVQGALFPYIAKISRVSRDRTLVILKKLLIYSTILMLISSILILIFADYVIYLISGNYISEATTTLRILSFFPVVITIARIFSKNYIITFDLEKYLLPIYMKTSLLSIILMFIFIPLLKIQGAAISVMLTEIFATFYMYIVIKRNIL